MAWVRNRKAKTTLERTEETAQALDLVTRAEVWLKTHPQTNQVLKWPTEEWGEIPADFGRK
jgi:ribonuclease HI